MKYQKKTAKAAFGCLLLLLLYGCAYHRTDAQMQDGFADEALITSSDEEQQDEVSASDDAPIQSGSDSRSLAVYVCGAVKHPGVYELAEGSRIYEALALAGGVTADAAVEAVNQAQLLTDGQMIRIPTEDEDVEPVAQEDTQADGRVNINTAGIDELKTLPGIGDSKARSIIAYREANGAFSAIEDIKNIEGIKEGVFAKLEDCIKVK